MRRLSALYWPGGKSGNGAGVGRWIADQLPWRYSSCYVEPFAGMLGVLLQRKPVQTEIVNDSDERVVNWWRVVRDRHLDLLGWTKRTFSTHSFLGTSVAARTECLWLNPRLAREIAPPNRA